MYEHAGEQNWNSFAEVLDHWSLTQENIDEFLEITVLKHNIINIKLC